MYLFNQLRFMGSVFEDSSLKTSFTLSRVLYNFLLSYTFSPRNRTLTEYCLVNHISIQIVCTHTHTH